MPQKRDKKLSKRERRMQDTGRLAPVGGSNLQPLSMSAPAHTWPVYECLVPVSWAEPGELITLVVTRRSESDEYASAIFLVDLGCLGVKNASTTRMNDDEDYEAFIEQQPVFGGQRIDIDLAAKIVWTAIDYAGSLGFRPHRDYALAAPFIRDAHPENAEEDVPTGKDGKPFFISGPYDNVQKIMAQLDKKVGPGNYQFLAGGPMGGANLDDLFIFDQVRESGTLDDGRH